MNSNAINKNSPRGRAVFYIKSIYILLHPVLGQVEGQTFSVFTAFLFFCFFDLPLSDANVAIVKAPARASKKILFMIYYFE